MLSPFHSTHYQTPKLNPSQRAIWPSLFAYGAKKVLCPKHVCWYGITQWPLLVPLYPLNIIFLLFFFRAIWPLVEGCGAFNSFFVWQFCGCGYIHQTLFHPSNSVTSFFVISSLRAIWPFLWGSGLQLPATPYSTPTFH